MTGMINTRILIIGVLFLLVMAVPVSAELTFQKTDDGKELISNGSYWIKWDPVSDHVVGDKFLINVTTNFPVGTKLGVEYLYSDWASVNVQGAGEEITIESGDNVTHTNVSSVLIDTTGLNPGEYLLLFKTADYPDPSFYINFPSIGVYDNLELYPKDATPTTVSPAMTTLSRTTPFTPASPNVTDTTHEKNTTVSSASTTPKPPLPAVTAIAALAGFSCLFLFARKNDDRDLGDRDD